MQASAQLDFSLTWALQSALTVGLAVACLVLAATFRRPAARILAANFLLWATATAIIWFAVSARALGFDPNVGAYAAIVSLPLFPLIPALLLLHLVRRLGGRTDRDWPRASAVGSTLVGGVALSAVLVAVTARSAANPVGVVGAAASLASIACFASLAIVTLRLRSEAREHRRAFGFLTASFLALVARSGMNVLGAAVAIASGSPPAFNLTFTVFQVFLVVVAGVLQIAAVLEEERASIVRAGEQLRTAEAAVARSHRLESLGRMAGAVAHDFNNVLTVIGLSAESARSGDRATMDDDLREVQASSKRGQELTRQLLAFARQAPQEVTRFDANEQISRLGEMLTRMTGKDVVLGLTLAPAPQLVDMDVTQFEQVVMNLVGNARDAMPAGGAITIRTGGDAGANGLVRISVEDTGTGISSDVLAHIFEPFYSTKKEGEGTGLGLAICDGIVRRAGGRIEVESVEGKGTRFDVLLPRAQGV